MSRLAELFDSPDFKAGWSAPALLQQMTERSAIRGHYIFFASVGFAAVTSEARS
jgi:hypothetical protein